jgi:outer membrane protein assembly factor BamB
VYACGATGVLVCLDAAKGAVVWSKSLTDAGGAVPMWGYAVSPLVTKNLVVCYSGGKGGKGVTAFDAADGAVKWQAGQGVHGYSAARLVTFAGVEQILMQSNYGLESFDPLTGKVLWEHLWKLEGGNRTTQPLVLGDGEVVVTTGVGQLASRRLKVTKDGDGWKVATAWQSGELSPYYNDGVVSDGHYYGFSGATFHCVDLSTGEQAWTKWEKYGNGQVLLFAEQKLLLVTEATKGKDAVGRVFLLKADPDPDATHELAGFVGLTGKTWNHPAFSRGRLYIRNGQEAACYELK